MKLIYTFISINSKSSYIMESNELYLFMDANIYLRFYDYSPDDIESLNTIYSQLLSQNIKIVINSLLEDEFQRRRESCFKTTLAYENDLKINSKLPILMSDDPDDYQKIEDAQKKLSQSAREYKKVFNGVLKKIQKKFLNGELYPDIIINKIFGKAFRIDMSSGILEKAEIRTKINNPPGNANEICDRVHWESFLEGIHPNHKLIIITKDKSFYSQINKSNINPFLKKEWENKKNAPIEIFETISDFLLCYLPDFELPGEILEQIREKINLLYNSPSYSETHSRVYELDKFYEHFTKNHIKSIISSYKNNPQIHNIICDRDVKDFLKKLRDHKNYDKALFDEEMALHQLRGHFNQISLN